MRGRRQSARAGRHHRADQLAHRREVRNAEPGVSTAGSDTTNVALTIAEAANVRSPALTGRAGDVLTTCHGLREDAVGRRQLNTDDESRGAP
jgi:hypothetical protein